MARKKNQAPPMVVDEEADPFAAANEEPAAEAVEVADGDIVETAADPVARAVVAPPPPTPTRTAAAAPITPAPSASGFMEVRMREGGRDDRGDRGGGRPQQAAAALAVGRIGSDSRTGTIGSPLAKPLSIHITRDGMPAHNICVRFEADPDDGCSFDGGDSFIVVKADENGVAKAVPTPTSAACVVKVVVGTKDDIRFTITATAAGTATPSVPTPGSTPTTPPAAPNPAATHGVPTGSPPPPSPITMTTSPFTGIRPGRDDGIIRPGRG